MSKPSDEQVQAQKAAVNNDADKSNLVADKNKLVAEPLQLNEDGKKKRKMKEHRQCRVPSKKAASISSSAASLPVSLRIAPSGSSPAEQVCGSNGRHVDNRDAKAKATRRVINSIASLAHAVVFDPSVDLV